MRRAIVLLLVASMLSWVSLALATEKKVEEHHIHGEVTSVDSAAKTFVVKETLKSGQTKDVTFAMGSKTKVTIKGKSGKFEDVKAGDSIHVRYIDKGHVHHAEEIAVVAPPAPKKT